MREARITGTQRKGSARKDRPQSGSQLESGRPLPWTSPKHDNVSWARVGALGVESGWAEIPLLPNNSLPGRSWNCNKERDGGWGESDEVAGAGPGWAGLTHPQRGAGPQEEQGLGAAGEEQTLERRYGGNQPRSPLLPADQETSRAHPDDRLHRPGHGQRCALLAATCLAQPRRLLGQKEQPGALEPPQPQ